jgi:hypothetical protein
MTPLDMSIRKPQIPIEQRLQAKAASLPWLSIAIIVMSLAAMGYVVLRLM